jgi:Na+/melibiose symporter-like transporter
VFGVCGAGFATWAARVPAVADRLGLTPGQLAIGLFALAAGSVVTLAGAGALITRIGSRTSALAGSAALCLGLPLAAVSPSLPVLVTALFVLGCGNGLLDVSMNAHAARVESEYGRPIFAGFHAFWNIGGLAGSGIAAIAASLRIPVAAELAGTGIVLLAISWPAISRCFLRGPDQGQGETAFALPGLALLPLGIIAFCGFVAEGTVNDWSAVYLTRSAGASAVVAPLGYLAFSLGMIAVRLAADRLAARFGVPRLIRLAVLVGVAGFAAVIAVTAPVVDILGFAVIGLGISAVVPLAWSSAARKELEKSWKRRAGPSQPWPHLGTSASSSVRS